MAEAVELTRATPNRCRAVLRTPWIRPTGAPDDRFVDADLVLLAMLTELAVKGEAFDRLYARFSNDPRLAEPLTFGRLKRGEDVRLLDDVPARGPRFKTGVAARIFDTTWILDRLAAWDG